MFVDDDTRHPFSCSLYFLFHGAIKFCGSRAAIGLRTANDIATKKQWCHGDNSTPESEVLPVNLIVISVS